MHQPIRDELEFDLDEGAIEPTRKQVITAGIISYFWLGLYPGAHMLPLGAVIVFFLLGSFTGAITLRGKLKHGKKAIFAALVGAALGYLLKAGLMLHFGLGGDLSITLRLL